MLGLQLGYRYADGALVDDGREDARAGDPVRTFLPSSRPGCRLPHGWVTREGHRVSTLDLVGLDGFTLLAGEESPWMNAPVPSGLRVLVRGRDFDDPEGWWLSRAGLAKDGALLVRPDQHVAARWSGAAPAAEVPAALGRILGSAASDGPAAKDA